MASLCCQAGRRLRVEHPVWSAPCPGCAMAIVWVIDRAGRLLDIVPVCYAHHDHWQDVITASDA